MPGITVDTKKTILMLVDMQNAIVKGEGPPYKVTAERQQLIDRWVKVIQAARGSVIPIMHHKVEFRADGTDAFRPALSTQPVAPFRARLVEGSPAAQIIDELKPHPEDYVVPRRRRNGFYGTPTETYLRSRGIETIIIGGIATNWGVESTVRDAADRDYNIIIIGDCCASFSTEIHEFALKHVLGRLGWVATAEEVIRLLTK